MPLIYDIPVAVTIISLAHKRNQVSPFYVGHLGKIRPRKNVRGVRQV